MDAATETPPTPVLSALRRTGRSLLVVPRPWAWLPAALWMALIWSLSSISGDEMTRLHDGPKYWQDLAHAGAFGLLALWFSLLLPRAASWVSTRPVGRVAVVLATAAWGIADEWHQSFVPGRHPTVLDLATDVTGAVCVTWIIAYAGSSAATERGLRRRLLACVAACAAVAGVSTVVHTAHPAPLWW